MGGTEYVDSDKTLLLHNFCDLWAGPWISGQRNHPSIFMWSAENECGQPFPIFTDDHFYQLETAIRKYDNTRPISYDGDGPARGSIVNLHYPGDGLSGSIYGWAYRLNPQKPTGTGECFLQLPGKDTEENYWIHGTWIRGMRYVGFTDVRPFTLSWALTENRPARAESAKRHESGGAVR